MEITAIIKDGRVSPLWHSVNQHLTVAIKRSSDSCWGAKVDARGKASLYVAPTTHPVESLSHELLHLKLHLDGYRNLRSIVWPADTTGSGGVHLIEALDNELQHHRMFPLFQSMGLDLRWFYHDRDVSVATYLSKAVRHRHQDFCQPLCDYLSLSAPGGTLTDAQCQHFQREFRRMASGVFAAKFDQVDHILSDWRQAVDLNAEPYVRRFFHLIEDPAIVWVGYGKTFPADGFFLDKPFRIK